MIELAYRQGSHRFALSSGGVNYRVQAHASVLDAMKHAEQRKAWPHHICSSLRTDNLAFHGTPDWNTAARLATRGWPEGRSMLRKAVAVMPKAAHRDRIIQWDLAGAYPDAARASAGAPDCMMDDQPTDMKHTQSVRVIVSMATPWTTSLDEFVNRGAAILSAVEAAEAAGHRVEVVAEETAISLDDGVSLSILLKAAGQPADRDSLAFFLIHPSSLRRIFFALLETEPTLEHFSCGYGMPACQPVELRPPGAIYLPSFDTGEYASPSQSFKHVKAAFTQAGCAVSFQT
jgi:hypothetical protein